ncbi:hypothetical protein HII36_45785 [Nonomuraea sp. NN258]|uniref:vWA domain-containing protein n=1 Tax=Nonomuraea antri TaxID=2730852 RepID=UPI0015694FC5|nr:VWA-like domain-containing protein [Nonomuraea antri]NRQ39087.1 hypothetical protein [Nonomuraea antri]
MTATAFPDDPLPGGSGSPAGGGSSAGDSVGARFAAARLWAADRAPYLTTALFALRPLAHEGPVPPGLPADEHWNVHLDAAEVARTPVPELGWWLLHQVGHLLRGHHGRATGDELTWDRAADAEINDDLDGFGDHGDFGDFGDLGDLADAAGTGAVEGRRGGPADAVSPETLGLPGGLLAERYVELLDLIDVPDHLVSCGRAPFTGPAALTPLERELLTRAVAAEIDARGDVPGGWRRWAESTLRPAADWRTLLAALVRRSMSQAAGRVDHSYRRPSRRSSTVPSVVLPALVRPEPRVVVLVDTSASVTEARLRQVLGELDGVLRAAGRRQVPVICCDARAYPAQVVRRAADVALVGGGGTDLRAGFAAAGPADLLVVLTDGETPWPDRRPRAAVVICLFGPPGSTPHSSGTRGSAPSWATVVHVPAGDAAGGRAAGGGFRTEGGMV